MKKAQMESKMEELLLQIDELKKIPRLLVKGFWFLFMGLWVGIAVKYLIWDNAGYVVDICIFAIFIGLTLIKKKMKQREQAEIKEAVKEEEE